MKLPIVLILLLSLNITLASRCDSICKYKFNLSSGRPATEYDHQRYGPDIKVDCTCVFPRSVSSKIDCVTYCNELNFDHKFYYYIQNICMIYVGV